MNIENINKIGKKYFGEIPSKISRKTIGICNEVYELTYDSDSYILRMHNEKEWIYGTHKFLPIFQKLEIKTPEIIAEDYSKTEFPFCYQVQTKIEGKDLKLVFHELTPSELKGIAKEVSNIFDKFNSLPKRKYFGGLTGLNEGKHESFLEINEIRKRDVLKRNAASNVLDKEIIGIYDELFENYKDYFTQLKPGLYYDDLCCKNLMIHNGKFSGLVDLDFLSKGDYLEVIGTMIASYYGEEYGKVYVDEIVKLQNLNTIQQEIIKVYAIFHLIGWTSEAGIKFNSNSTGEINWENVNKNRRKIIGIYKSIKE